MINPGRKAYPKSLVFAYIIGKVIPHSTPAPLRQASSSPKAKESSLLSNIAIVIADYATTIWSKPRLKVSD